MQDTNRSAGTGRPAGRLTQELVDTLPDSLAEV